MPIHEYVCRMCDERFERLYRKPADVPSTWELSCPQCGGVVRRLVGAASLGGRVDVGVGQAAWPSSWSSTQGGNPEILRAWRRRVERETREEQRNPELVQCRQANAVRRYEERHGPGSAETASRQNIGEHTHPHAWTAVPFVAPTPDKP